MPEHAYENGGVDILISNAGIAASGPVEETSLALWNKNMDILSKGYFLVSREALRLMRAQGMEGAIVFIASKNGLAASPNASAYCTAKAAEIHLARCLGLDFFDATISRTAAWVIGTRNMQKALLRALLQPMGLLRRAEDDKKASSSTIWRSLSVVKAAADWIPCSAIAAEAVRASRISLWTRCASAGSAESVYCMSAKPASLISRAT